MQRIDIRGVMIPNDYKWYYDWFGEDSTCPGDVRKILDIATDGEEIAVYFNSPGGVIDVGSEIYTMFREADKKYRMKGYVVGEACSAASVAAMAIYCEMSPTALMMVHCVSSGAKGNHAVMEHTAGMLRTADRAMCTAYTAKTGMAEQEALEMMEKETWLTAAQAKEMGLVDAVMFEEPAGEDLPLVAGPLFRLPTKEQLDKVRNFAAAPEEKPVDAANFMREKAQATLNLMKLTGGTGI